MPIFICWPRIALRDGPMEQIATWLNQHTFGVTTILLTIALLAVASILLARLNRLLRGWARGFESRLRLPYETVIMLIRVLTIALWTIVGVIVLDMWGVEVGGVWTLLVSAATLVGVGFLATWAMVSNVTASFFMTVWRPFHFEIGRASCRARA